MQNCVLQMGLNSYNKFIVSEYENIKYRKNRDNKIK